MAASALGAASTQPSPSSVSIDDIDSDWTSDDLPPVAPSTTDQVPKEMLRSPSFPADPAVPADLRPPVKSVRSLRPTLKLGDAPLQTAMTPEAPAAQVPEGVYQGASALAAAAMSPAAVSPAAVSPAAMSPAASGPSVAPTSVGLTPQPSRPDGSPRDNAPRDSSAREVSSSRETSARETSARDTEPGRESWSVAPPSKPRASRPSLPPIPRITSGVSSMPPRVEPIIPSAPNPMPERSGSDARSRPTVPNRPSALRPPAPATEDKAPESKNAVAPSESQSPSEAQAAAAQATLDALLGPTSRSGIQTSAVSAEGVSLTAERSRESEAPQSAAQVAEAGLQTSIANIPAEFSRNTPTPAPRFKPEPELLQGTPVNTARPSANPWTAGASAAPNGVEKEFLAATALRSNPRHKYVFGACLAAAAVVLWIVTRPAPRPPELRSQAASPAAEMPSLPIAAESKDRPTQRAATASESDVAAAENAEKKAGASETGTASEPSPPAGANAANAARDTAQPREEARADASQPSSGPAAAEGSAASASDAAKGDKVFVHITAKPADVQLFYKGKSIGKPPLTIELKPGETRTFEAILAGHTTRKVRVDGTKPEMMIGLRPVSTPSP
ncbi:MAG TPA: hypothetical protein VFQ61_39680 [Polyangiaceae bacterium]|nr:hypothetical protein [Polyangiaceae bacterium]